MEESTIQEAKKSSVNPMLIAAIILVVLVVAGGVLYVAKKAAHKVKNEAIEHMTNMPVHTSPTVAATGSATPSMTTDNSTNTVTVNIEAGSFYFKPSEIKVKKGQTVKIVFHAVSMMHNFSIDAFNVRGPLTRDGDTSTVQFVADKVGTFQYYCAVGNHKQMGQVGTLTVE